MTVPITVERIFLLVYIYDNVFDRLGVTAGLVALFPKFRYITYSSHKVLRTVPYFKCS